MTVARVAVECIVEPRAVVAYIAAWLVVEERIGVLRAAKVYNAARLAAAAQMAVIPVQHKFLVQLPGV